tara:strand:- start:1090 stop:2289 length:1200 start_codon:yes stop_codon:yes gene_type:complete
MKIVNLNFLIQKINYSETIINENLNRLFKIDEPILLYDVAEGSRMWPLDKEGGDPSDNASYMFFRVHEGLRNHKHDIWFLCSDLNIQDRYENFCSLTGNDKKFKLLCFPFSIKTGFSFHTDSMIRQLNKKQKKWNFCQLTSGPQTVRLVTLDRFYKNKNFQYSYVPQFHFRKGEKIEHGMVYEEEKDTKFPNNFDVNSTKLLTEIDLNNTVVDGGNDKILINDIMLDKKIFDHTLPLENHESCCDIVFETYCNGPTFFTEKTWKEFVFERPFILFGNKGCNKILQNLGFEIFDEIFDYSFDDEPNTYERLKMFWVEIEKYIDLNVEGFAFEIKKLDEKVKHNRKLYNDYIMNFEPIFKVFESGFLHYDEYSNQDDFFINNILDVQFKTLKKTCKGFFDL